MRFASFCFQYDNIYYAKYIRGEWWGEEEGIQINKTISLCLGETPGIQSGPAASEDYQG